MAKKQAVQKVIPLMSDSYLAVINNSIGSKLFRNFYARVDGRKVDIMRNGELSCAFYVSSILSLFKLIKSVHGTVESTIEDLRHSGWRVTKQPKVGSVVVWGQAIFGHRHIGFYIGNGYAVSNSSRRGYPVKHHWVFPKRRAELVLWSRKLSVLDQSRSHHGH